MKILQNLKLALKSTLWFFIPSIIIATAIFIESTVVLSPGFFYDFLFFHNIPFFLGSFLLIMLLWRGTNRMLSIVISNIVTIGLWYFFLFVSTDNAKGGHAAIAVFAPGFLAYTVFFLRSFIEYEFINTDTGKKIFVESKDMNKFIKFAPCIVYFIIIVMFLS